MRDLRLLLSPRVAIVVVVLGSWVTSFSFGGFMYRLDGPPDSSPELVSHQLQMPLLLLAAAGGLGAWTSARLVAGQGRDLWASSSLSALRRAAAVHAIVMLPVAAAWCVFWIFSTLQFARGPVAPVTVVALAASVTAFGVAAAVGQGLGYVLPRWLAPPVAAATAYLGAAVVSVLGDNLWWQGLGPGLAQVLPDDHAIAWLAGEGLWFLGLTAVILASTATFLAVPRLVPRRVVTGGLAAMTAGALLVWLFADAGVLATP